MSKTAVHLLDRILRPHGRAPCTMPSNPGHAIVLQDNAVTSMTKHTYLALSELFGGVINLASINYVTSILCSYASSRRTRAPEGYLTGDYVRLYLTKAHTSHLRWFCRSRI